MSTSTSTDVDALSVVISALKSLEAEDQRRVLESAALFLGIGASAVSSVTQPATAVALSSEQPQQFADRPGMSPKEFLLGKQPRTDVERVACLAFYLTHYLDTPHFKTLDLSKLNTEAAQPKFGNAAYSANNALKRGYLVQATKGKRQLRDW